MKKTTYLVFLIILTAVFSCEKGGLLVNCKDCYLEEPEMATMFIKLNTYNQSTGYFTVRVNVYSGNLEDSILIVSDITTNSDWEFKGYFDTKYAFTATYVSLNNTYTAIGGAFPRVRLAKEQCEEPCYFVYDNKVNLRLKYPKL